MVGEKRRGGASVVAPRKKMQLGKLGPSIKNNQIRIYQVLGYKIVRIFEGPILGRNLRVKVPTEVGR